MSAVPLMNLKNAQSMTPLTCPKFNLKPPSRKLWEKEKSEHENYRENWSRYRHNMETEKWDVIQSPQYIDFSSLSDSRESFFEQPMSESTPKPVVKLENHSTGIDEDTLIPSFNISLNSIKMEKPQESIHVDNNNKNEKNKERYAFRKPAIKLETQLPQTLQCRAPKPTTVVNPFSFDTREKLKKEKQERTNKVPEDDKKQRVFRANPVPKLSKPRWAPSSKEIDYTNTHQIPKPSVPEKPAKKTTEVWKKKPFQPSLPERVAGRPKTPPLLTAVRAKERKRFDDAVKEKERQMEQARQMEMYNKKKQEEEEIARLRKQTVHKAQPIRRYKSGLPEVQKRPLTDPLSPKTLKRRRRFIE